MENKLNISVNQNEKSEFVTAIASRKISNDHIVEWIQSHIVK